MIIDPVWGKNILEKMRIPLLNMNALSFFSDFLFARCSMNKNPNCLQNLRWVIQQKRKISR
jgi:hypothetical protein